MILNILYMLSIFFKGKISTSYSSLPLVLIIFGIKAASWCYMDANEAQEKYFIYISILTDL